MRSWPYWIVGTLAGAGIVHIAAIFLLAARSLG